MSSSQRAESGTHPWSRCTVCRNLNHHRRFTRNLRVCPGCGHHEPVPAPERIEQLLDAGSIDLFEAPATVDDPLGFVDSVSYQDRLATARERTALFDAAVGARGSIHGRPVVLVVMDFRFLGGSLGGAVGEIITAAAEEARARGHPLLIVTSSGGARMQEGVLALMQMAKTSQAFAALDEAGVLTVSVIADPTFGGVAASFATLADVIVIEPEARMGFAGPRVIEQTIRQTLPQGFQTADFLLAQGQVDAVVPRADLRETLVRLVTGAGGLVQGDQMVTASEPSTVQENTPTYDHDPWQSVRLARETDRPTTLDYAGMMLEDFQELHGDRICGDSPALVGGIGRLDGRSVMLIGHQKGHSTRELIARNFGMPTPEGYRKAARLMRLADKLAVPVITLVDTPGAYPGVSAEEHGQSAAIAECQRLMAQLSVPVVTAITGEGGSGGALALALADRVLMLQNAWYSVISPEGCAAILWKTPAAAPKAATALRLTASDLLRLGVVDQVITEPGEGAHIGQYGAAETLKATLRASLQELSALAGTELTRQRRARFRAFGGLTTVRLEPLGGE